MSNKDRNYMIHLTEEYYCKRMGELVDLCRFNDSDAIFSEFVVNGQEPEEWFFATYLSDVC